MKICYTIILLLFMLNISAQSFSLEGKVLDESNTPIDAVTCILRWVSDSSIVQTVLSDDLGSFVFSDLGADKYKLYLQHIAYQSQEIDIDLFSNMKMESVTLIASENRLADVIVKGERPLVKSEDGKLVYDAQRLIEGKVVSNAYEILTNTPGVMAMGDKIELVGATKYAILINGQLSSMNYDQLINLLKSTPASRVSNIEIMYSVPPKYNIRGAVINVTLKEHITMEKSLQGEAKVEYRQKHYANFGTQASLLYSHSHFSVDFMLDVSRINRWTDDDMYALHQLKGDEYDISQHNRGDAQGYDYNTRLGLNYSLKNKHRLQAVYNGNFRTTDSDQKSKIDFLKNDLAYKNLISENNSDKDVFLHNVKTSYSSHKDFEVEVDYTYYKDPTNQRYKDSENNILQNVFKTNTSQRVDKTLIYANHISDVGKGWKLDYGGNYSYSNSVNDYNYFESIDGLKADSISRTDLREHNASLFVGFKKSFTPKLSIQASVSGNYFKSTSELGGERKTLWEEFQPFVNANLTYTINPKRIFQLSFSSDIEYPAYWALSPNTWKINAYSESQGNPELKFSKEYNTQAMYIMEQKYIVMGFYKYVSDYSTQLPFQSNDELLTIFQVTNLDYMRMYGMAFIAPFIVGSVLNSKATLNVFRIEEKDGDFYDIPYKRGSNAFRFQLSNTINVSSKPNIKLDVSGYYGRGMIQGVYDIGDYSDVSAGVKWSFLGNNAELLLQVNDIFERNAPVSKVNFADQYSRMRVNTDTRTFRASFIYRFGNYKKKAMEKIDKSRFSRN